jgi:hypothetical protein
VYQLKELWEIPEFEPHINTLSEHEVTTVEQFLSLAMSGSKDGLCQLLNLSEEEMNSLIGIARENVDPEFLEKMETTEVKEYPLGYLEDKEEEKDEDHEVRDA